VKKNFTLTSLILTALVALMFTSCKKEGGEAAGDEILVGHFASMTGQTATFGQSADKGILLAVDEINAAGGVLGKKIKIITEDDQSKAEDRSAPWRSCLDTFKGRRTYRTAEQDSNDLTRVNERRRNEDR
jgi:hypothetical protein